MMHHKDYEIAERCLQDLRDGRSKPLTAEDVQGLAVEMTMVTNTSPFPSGADSGRGQASLAVYELAKAIEGHPEESLDYAWNEAIRLTARWFEALA
jgi:hypothetical protein